MRPSSRIRCYALGAVTVGLGLVACTDPTGATAGRTNALHASGAPGASAAPGPEPQIADMGCVFAADDGGGRMRVITVNRSALPLTLPALGGTRRSARGVPIYHLDYASRIVTDGGVQRTLHATCVLPVGQDRDALRAAVDRLPAARVVQLLRDADRAPAASVSATDAPRFWRRSLCSPIAPAAG